MAEGIRLAAEAAAPVISPADTNHIRAPDRKKAEALLGTLKRKRVDFEDRWKDIRDYQLPYLGEFEDTEDESNKARRRDLSIANGIPWAANVAFAAGVMSGLTPPSRQWFKLGFSQPGLSDNQAAARVLEERQSIMEALLHNSNFYTTIHSAYMELAFGQVPVGIFASPQTGVRFQKYNIGTYYLGAAASGRTNIFARRYQMNADQIVEQFGKDHLPQVVKDALQSNTGRYGREFKVNWLVMPNTNRTEGEPGAVNMPYLSLYWLDGQGPSDDGGYLYVGGFQEFPTPVARYQTIEGTAYGKGPGWYAEGDARALQVEKKDFLTAIELYVKPPMTGPPEVMNAGGINMMPGGYTPTNPMLGNGQGIRPLYQVTPQLDPIAAEIQRTEENIKRTYSADLFLMLDSIDTPQMTAREVMERQQEKLQQLGPVVERLQDEFLSPIIERVYNIAERMGLFPGIPDEVVQELGNAEVKIEYISPLAQAQKMSGLVNIEQAVSFVAQMGQLYPEALKTVDAVGTVHKYFELLGAPSSMQRPTDQVYEEIQAEQKMMQEQAEQQQALQSLQAAAPAAQAARNMTEAANDGNPAMQQLLGMG